MGQACVVSVVCDIMEPYHRYMAYGTYPKSLWNSGDMDRLTHLTLLEIFLLKFPLQVLHWYIEEKL